MKKLLFLIASMVVPMSMLASGRSEVVFSPISDIEMGNPVSKAAIVNGSVVELSSDGKFTATKHTNVADADIQMKKAPSNTTVVTLEWEGDYPAGALNYPSYQLLGGSRSSGDLAYPVEIDIPEEGCDVLVTTYGETLFYVIVKHIDPNNDTVVKFSLDDAVNHVGFRPVSPEGDALTWSYGNGSELVKEGNIISADIIPVIYHEKSNVIQYNAYLGVPFIFDDYTTKEYPYGDIMTNLEGNNTDIKLMLCCRYEVQDVEEGISFGVFYDNISTQTILTNTPADFVLMEANLGYALNHDDYERSNETINNPGILYDSSYLIGIGTYDAPLSEFNATISSDSEFHSTVYFERVEAEYTYTETPLYVNDDNSEIIISYNPLKQIIGRAYWKDSPLNFTPSDMLQPFNEGPAFMSVFNTMTPYEGKNIGNFALTSYGLMDELRANDQKTIKASMAFNGETVYSNLTPNSLNKKMEEWYFTNETLGYIDFTFENTNYAIDNVVGNATAIMHIDQTNDDQTAPIIYAISVRTPEDKIGYKFSNQDFSGMKLYISSIDANLIEDGKYSFSVAPKSVTAEYCMHGGDSFEPLELTQYNSEASNAFGFLYIADLSKLSVDAENLMYDLRITSTDEAGNSISETISPAFCMNCSSTGIEVNTLGNSNSPVETVYYDISGTQVTNKDKGVLIRLDKYSDGSRKVTKIVK